MKKVALLMLVILVMLTLFSGCGSKSPSDDVTSERDRPSQNTKDTEEDEESEDSSITVRPFTDQGVYEYIDHVLNTYNRDLVLRNLEELLEDRLYYFAYTNLTDDSLVVRYEDLSDYISTNELTEFSEILDYYISIWDWARDYDSFYYTVQYVDDMQKGYDELFGKGSIDIGDMLEELLAGDENIYLSKDGVLIVANSYDPTDDKTRANTYYQITEINMEGDTAKVYANYIVLGMASNYNQYGRIFDRTDYRSIGVYVDENDWSVKYRDYSFDEMISQMGIDKKTLGEFEFSIKKTSGGPALDGIEIIDHKPNNFLSNLVVPDSLLVFLAGRIVLPEAGLNLRTGPGTNYDVITLLPRGSIINELVNNGDPEGWLFVSCTIDGTEYFGWVSGDREYLMYAE